MAVPRLIGNVHGTLAHDAAPSISFATASDFGKDGTLRAELAQEARARLGQDVDLLRYCPGIPFLMSQLGTASAPPPRR